MAWRMVTELVAGLAIGFAGFGLDYLFGTTPFLMVVCAVRPSGRGQDDDADGERDWQDPGQPGGDKGE